MKNLTAYVEMENRFAKIWGEPEINVTELDDTVAQRLFQKLDCQLSPENISCDGELPRAEVNRRFKLYTGAIADLKKMGFVPAEQMYNG